MDGHALLTPSAERKMNVSAVQLFKKRLKSVFILERCLKALHKRIPPYAIVIVAFITDVVMAVHKLQYLFFTQ